MNAEAILQELTHAGGLPTEALQAASAQRAELLPKFLGVIEDYLGQEPAARANPTPLFFIFHLLGDVPSPTLMGYVADHHSLQAAFILPVIAMAVSSAILFYGMRFAPPLRPQDESASQVPSGASS